MTKWFQYILDNPDKGWNYKYLSYNPNITWEIVKANPDKDWNYYLLSGNPNITWEIVKANPEKPWNYCYLSANPNITWEIVKANPEKPWNYLYLSLNSMGKYDLPFCIMKRKAKERIEKIKEELIAKAWHPSRVERWLEAGIDIEDC